VENLDKGHQVIWRLREAKDQNVRVDVYVKYAVERIIYIDGVPVDFLSGAEAGLIRECDPAGNRQFRLRKM
jgi:hypothetical protein